MEDQKQTILIVDDEPVNIRILSEALRADYGIIFATNGVKALELAFELSPDLILLDIMMPEMDGDEVCVRLKNDPRTKFIPVIFITGMDNDDDEEKGLSIGAIDYITKPIRPAILRIRVRNHLELKRYRDFLQNMSTTDGLTGLANRWWFDTFLEREWLRSTRNRTPLSLIMMDVDFFKKYNDHFGHVGGDECLRKVAGSIAKIIKRPSDLAARYGGEEFVCVLPDTNAAGAMAVAAQIRSAVNELNMPHPKSSAAAHVSVSIGVAAIIPEAGRPRDDLITLADGFLYNAKEQGRNRIVTGADEKPE